MIFSLLGGRGVPVVKYVLALAIQYRAYRHPFLLVLTVDLTNDVTSLLSCHFIH